MANSTAATFGLALLVAAGVTVVSALGNPGLGRGAGTPATLAVSPSAIGAPGDVSSARATCPFSTSQRAWTCSVALWETVSSNGPASWAAGSPANASFAPDHGTLEPGMAVTVAIEVTSCGGHYPFEFVGPHNTATVVFSCG